MTNTPRPCATCVHLERHFPSGMPFCGRSGLPAKAERRGRLFTNCGPSGRWHQPRPSLSGSASCVRWGGGDG